ncbi:MAG: metallophosphoesterase, partial [Deltaproteobacteria bacterium]|nr:metallophosphoesterase [Deltaproteobacteria bacterium]
MSTWIIGDIQGCFDSFQVLLDRLAYRPGRDMLWLAGDLVNRGPRSLDVIRWVRAHDAQVRVVLGNHDLHLLACATGVVKARKRDTLASILALPSHELTAVVDWLRAKPLVIREGENLLVHAGIWPGWTWAVAEARAREAEALLRSEDWT